MANSISLYILIVSTIKSILYIESAEFLVEFEVLTVIAEALSRAANLGIMANVAALVASSTG